MSGAPAADIPGDDKPPEGGARLEILAELLRLPTAATLEEIYQAVAAQLNNQTALKFKVDGVVTKALKRHY